MTPALAHRHCWRVVSELVWHGDEVRTLEERPAGLPVTERWDRLTTLDRCAVGAAFALDDATGGSVRARGDRLAGVIGATWTSTDGAVTFLRRASRGERYGGIIRDFAQMGGPSTYHRLASCLGIRGYATFVIENPLEEDDLGLIDDVAQLPGIDGIVELHISLPWVTANPLLNAVRPASTQVSARLLDIVSAGDGNAGND
jgi:hypothetical protein